MRTINRAIKGRLEEINLYRINIYNFRHVASQIGSAGEYQEFRAQLLARADSEAFEMGKAKMVLAALREQRAAAPWWMRAFV